MPQTHASQFPADFAPPAALAESAASAYCDLIDTSDENDASPSFAFPIETPHFDRNRAEYSELFATIWSGHPDPYLRKPARAQRFAVIAANPASPNDPYFTFATDDALHALRIAHELSLWATSVFTAADKVIDRPTYPEKPIESFSDLHDHVDANVLGISETMWERYDGAECLRHLRIDLMNAVQNMVDDWIMWRVER